MNKKGLLALFLIFVLMYVLNNMFPMMNEDYFAAFVWPEGVPNLGALPENTRKVQSFYDLLKNCKMGYFTEGGRLPGGFPGGFFSWQGKEYFNFFNALMIPLLIAEIYWISHEGKITFDFDVSYVIWIFFSLWAFNLGFLGTCLWMSGSSNYLWMVVVDIAFLIPYVNNYFDRGSLNQDSVKRSVSMFLLGLLAGWSHETTVCWLILILFYWLLIVKKTSVLLQWQKIGFIGFCIGYALLVLAPGNFSRLQTQEHEVLSSKLSELIVIMIFQIFIWYFVIKGLLVLQRKILPSLNYGQQAVIKPYVNIVKSSLLVAFGSSLIMFLIPVPGIRPSFLSLVFLTVAAAVLYRTQEVIGEFSFFSRKTSLFLKFLGYSYLIVTILVSLYWNYYNRNYWNDILTQIDLMQKCHSDTILEVEPYLTSKKPIWHLISGFHIFGMPVASTDENDRINRTVAKYYGIKGIRLIKNE